jgi:hypothetical protein
MDGFDRCIEKLDRISATLRDIHHDTPKIIITTWVCFFYLPIAAFVLTVWLSK